MAEKTTHVTGYTLAVYMNSSILEYLDKAKGADQTRSNYVRQLLERELLPEGQYPNMRQPDDAWISLSDLSELTHVSENSLRALCRTGAVTAEQFQVTPNSLRRTWYILVDSLPDKLKQAMLDK